MTRTNIRTDTSNASDIFSSPLNTGTGLKGSAEQTSAQQSLFVHRSFDLPRSYNFRSLGSLRIEGAVVLGLDMDGVLCNHLNYHELVAQTLCVRCGTNISMAEIVAARERSEDLWYFAMKKVWERFDIKPGDNVRGLTESNLREALRRIEKYDHGSLRDGLLICPEAREFLETMPILPFVATNRQEEAALEGMVELGISRLENNWFCQVGQLRTKPNEDMIIRAVEELGVPKDATIIFADDSGYLGELQRNVAHAGWRLIPVGILPPGYGKSKQMERALLENGAEAVYPSLNHLLKDLARYALGDMENYTRIKYGLRIHHRELGLPPPPPKEETL